LHTLYSEHGAHPKGQKKRLKAKQKGLERFSPSVRAKVKVIGGGGGVRAKEQ
jgi:hypothetical protein